MCLITVKYTTRSEKRDWVFPRIALANLIYILKHLAHYCHHNTKLFSIFWPYLSLSIDNVNDIVENTAFGKGYI